MTDKELIQELRSKAEVEGAGSTRRLLELAARALERRQWVSVKDRLPDELIELYCYECVVLAIVSGQINGTKCDHSYMIVIFSHMPEQEPEWFNPDSTFIGDEITVHYWMPLPEPPEEVSGND